jgi:hypothetical protein
MKIRTDSEEEIKATARAKATETQIRRLNFHGVETPANVEAKVAQVAIDQIRDADPEAEARYQAWRPCLIANLASPPQVEKKEFDGTIRVRRAKAFARVPWLQALGRFFGRAKGKA